MAKTPNGNGATEATSNTASDDIAECYVEYVEMMGSIARVRQRISATLQRYQGMGVNTKAVRACYRLANMDDAPDYVREMLKAAAILKIIPAEVEDDGQMTFLPGLKVAAPSAKAEANRERSSVFWSAWDAGKSGSPAENNPHEPGSEDHVTWAKGWKDGHADYAARPKNANVEQAPSTPRPRGRPRRVDRIDDRTQLERDEAAFRGAVQ
jgi:uncharacterized protein (UPF0335 family)